MEINITNFYNLKNNSECLELDTIIINTILASFDNNDNKKLKKSNYKKNNFIQKVPKNKITKDKISNKVKLILNKLSYNNINNLVIEFIQTIKVNTQEDYNEFLKTLFLKVLSEINFAKVYLDFLKNISCTFSKILNYDISYFYYLIENKFRNDYFNEGDDICIDVNNDDYRVNNLKLIKEMISLEFMDNNIEKMINEKILNQNLYLSDIYYWFKDTKIEYTNIEKIKNILDKYLDIDIRDKILLQNLILPYESDLKKNKIVFKKKKNLSFEDSIKELLNDYLINDNYIIIKSFIESTCKEITEKNKFCEIIFNTYFNSNFKCILDLIDELVSNEVLYKSNISKALINLYNENTDILNDQKKINELVTKLKNLGITKNLEFLIDI